MTGLLIVLFLLVLAVVVPRYGADSRDGQDWRRGSGERRPPAVRPAPLSDVAAVARWVRRRVSGSRIGRRLARAWRAQERAWEAAWLSHQPWRGDDVPLRWPDILAAVDREYGITNGTPEAGMSDSEVSGREATGAGYDELRWRRVLGRWRLEGSLLPIGPTGGNTTGNR